MFQHRKLIYKLTIKKSYLSAYVGDALVKTSLKIWQWIQSAIVN